MNTPDVEQQCRLFIQSNSFCRPEYVALSAALIGSLQRQFERQPLVPPLGWGGPMDLYICLDVGVIDQAKFTLLTS